MPDNNRLINCDNTEGIGEAIQKGLEGTYLHTTKIKSKSKVQPIACLCSTVVIKERNQLHFSAGSQHLRKEEMTWKGSLNMK